MAILLTSCAARPSAGPTGARRPSVLLRGETFFIQDADGGGEDPEDSPQDGPPVDPPVDPAEDPQEAPEAYREVPGDAAAPAGDPDALPLPLLEPVGQSAPIYGPVAPGEETGLEIHGTLSTRYIRRQTGGKNDDDIYTFLSLDVGDKARDARTFHLDGRVSYSVSGDEDEFGGLDDSYSGSTRARLYNAYVDFNDVEADVLRVGRQTDYETPEVIYYDGVHFRTESLDEDDTQLGVFGGISNHLYESSTDGDRVYGVYAETQPWDGGRVRVDWLHADDDRTLGSLDDDLIGIQAWQGFDRLRLEGSFTRLENDNRDVRVASTWFDPEDDLLVRASYYRLLETQSTSALEFDELTTTLFDLYPYEQIDVSAAHGVAQDVYLQGGASIRIVDDDDDKTDFNRDVDRFYITAAFEDVVSEKNTVSVTAEYWEGDDNESEALGMDLTRDMSDDLVASCGTYYSLYKTDFTSSSEREDVQTYYVRFDYDVSEAYDIDFGYEYEDSDVGNFHTIRMAARWRF